MDTVRADSSGEAFRRIHYAYVFRVAFGFILNFCYVCLSERAKYYFLASLGISIAVKAN